MNDLGFFGSGIVIGVFLVFTVLVSSRYFATKEVDRLITRLLPAEESQEIPGIKQDDIKDIKRMLKDL